MEEPAWILACVWPHWTEEGHYSSGAQGGRSWHGLDWAWDLPYLTPKPMFSALQDELHQGRGSCVLQTPC